MDTVPFTENTFTDSKYYTYIIEGSDVERQSFESYFLNVQHINLDDPENILDGGLFTRVVGHAVCNKANYSKYKDKGTKSTSVVLWYNKDIPAKSRPEIDATSTVYKLDISSSIEETLISWAKLNNYKITGPRVNKLIELYKGDVLSVKSAIRRVYYDNEFEADKQTNVFKLQDLLVTKNPKALPALNSLLTQEEPLVLLATLVTLVRRITNAFVILSTGGNVKDVNAMLNKPADDRYGKSIIDLCKKAEYTNVTSLMCWLSWADKQIKIKFRDSHESLLQAVTGYVYSKKEPVSLM